MDAGLWRITGLGWAEGEAVAVSGLKSCVNPGIALDNVFIPRPLLVLVPPSDDRIGAPVTGAVPDDVVGLESAPAIDRDVVAVVVVIADAAGAAVLDVVAFTAVASLLCTCVMAPSLTGDVVLSVEESV